VNTSTTYTVAAMSGRTQQQQLISASKRRKGTQPPVFTGVSGSYEDKDNDFLWYTTWFLYFLWYTTWFLHFL